MESSLILDRLNKMLLTEETVKINEETDELISLLKNTLSAEKDIFNENGEDYHFVINDLEYIKELITSERKKYYLNRLIKSLTEVKTGKINDINLNRWKEYKDILTDSLWLISRRDRSGSHSGKYWGNFIPQIPNQLLRRYTKKGEWVLDPFCGSGTTLIESKKLGRNCLGLDLAPEAVEEARLKITEQPGNGNVITDAIASNSLHFNYEEYLYSKGIKSFQFMILHPPYWDIIRFSDDPADLSNCASPEDFLALLGDISAKIYEYLDDDRFLALVIGDKYNKGEWVPLGFQAMQEVMKNRFKLKSIIVKNFEETRGKMQQKELWRYRALAGGFYIFKHEYIFLFEKQKKHTTRVSRKEIIEDQSQAG